MSLNYMKTDFKDISDRKPLKNMIFKALKLEFSI